MDRIADSAADATQNLGVQYLEARGVLLETFEAHGGEITGVDRYRIRLELAWETKSLKIGDAEAILHFPIFGLNGTSQPESQPESWIVRFLWPKGTPHKYRFLLPIGKRSPIWIPSVTREIIKDASQPIILTEGIVKGLALVQAGGFPIAFQGVWNVQEPKPKLGSKEKEPKPAFEDFELKLKEESGVETSTVETVKVEEEPETKCKLRNELEKFPWFGRKIYLAFDADWRFKESVRQATIRTAFMLIVQGAQVYQLTQWDLSEGNGIDDYLATKGRAEDGRIDPEKQKQALAGLIEGAKPFIETLEGLDSELAKKELHAVAMDEVWFSSLSKELAKQLKVRSSSLGPWPRPKQKEEESAIVEIPPTAEPWGEPVEVKEILEEIERYFSRFVWMLPHQNRMAALFAVLTYLHDAVSILPLLLITSPESECGKTTLLEVLFDLCNRPVPASNISAAAIYRDIKVDCPTLILDEADTYLNQKDDALRGVINSGHKRRMAFVRRVIDDSGKVGGFSTWCPKAIAMIGTPKGSILGRSIHIRLQRKEGSQPTEFHGDDHYEKAEEFRRKLSRLANDIREKIKLAPVENLLGNRAGDNWRPLFAIAREAGEEYLRGTIEAAKRILRKPAKDRDDFNAYLISALGDLVRQMRERKQIPAQDNFFIKTEDILDGDHGLNSDKEAPWAEKPNGLSAHLLGRVLSEYVIEHARQDMEGTPRAGRGRKRPSGYRAHDIEKVALRYQKNAEG